MSATIQNDSSAKLGSGQMFDNIAPGYDRLNRIMSLGIDQGWRRKAVEALAPASPKRILDLATGTADIALAVAARFPEVKVSGVDPSAGMLDIGREKVSALGLDERVTLEVGDGQDLPHEDDTFDGAIISFGIRNVPDRALALREMARVTRKGGRVVVLELTEPRGVLGPLARFHIHTVVPRLGAWLSGAREYMYLQESIAAFPPAEEFAAMMGESGMEVVGCTPLTFGVCTLFVGEVQ